MVGKSTVIDLNTQYEKTKTNANKVLSAKSILTGAKDVGETLLARSEIDKTLNSKENNLLGLREDLKRLIFQERDEVRNLRAPTGQFVELAEVRKIHEKSLNRQDEMFTKYRTRLERKFNGDENFRSNLKAAFGVTTDPSQTEEEIARQDQKVKGILIKQLGNAQKAHETELKRRHEEQKRYIAENWYEANRRQMLHDIIQGRSKDWAALTTSDIDKLENKAFGHERAYRSSKKMLNPLLALVGIYDGTMVVWHPAAGKEPAHFTFHPLDAAARKKVCQELRAAGYTTVWLRFGMKRVETQVVALNAGSSFGLRNAAIAMKLNLLTGGMEWPKGFDQQLYAALDILGGMVAGKVTGNKNKALLRAKALRELGYKIPVGPGTLLLKPAEFLLNELGIVDTRFPLWTAKTLRIYFNKVGEFPPGFRFYPENPALEYENIHIDSYTPTEAEERGFKAAKELYKEAKKIHVEIALRKAKESKAKGLDIDEQKVFKEEGVRPAGRI